MSLDKLQIDVNVADSSSRAIRKHSAADIFLDTKGRLLFVRDGGLGRIFYDEKDLMRAEMIGGGGTRQASAVGENIPLVHLLFEGTTTDWYVCQVEEDVYWCVGGYSPYSILQVDTRTAYAEVIFRGVKNGQETGRGGSFAPQARYDQRAVINRPRGPLFAYMGPNGTQVYFYDGCELRIADLRTKEVITRKFAVLGNIHDPSLIRPSKQILSSLSSNGLPQNDTVNNNISPNLTWSTTGETTLLVDLNSGHNVVLFQTSLYPLLALSSSVVLAIENYRFESYFVKVDWSLPPDLTSSGSVVKGSESRYLLPNERITRLSQLPPNFGGWSPSFLFDPSVNQLYCNGGDAVHIFSDIFNITTTSNLPIYPTFEPGILDSDLSKLLDECALPYDLQLTHSASNASWNVHYSVLNRHEGLKKKEDIDRLARIVKNSTLPASSISAFLKFLYLSCPVDLTNAIESFMPLCHCIQLCNQVGIGSDHTNHLLWLLETKVVQKLPTPVLLQKILTLWLVEQDPSPESIATYSTTSPLMSLFASRCRKYASNEEIHDATTNFDFSKATAPLPKVMGLCASFGIFLSPGSSVPLAEIELLELRPFITLQPLIWDENLSVVPHSPPADKYAFVFTIKGLKTGGVICNALYLYPQWRWFERLCKTKNCDEFTTRHVAMPEYYTPLMILSILSSCYGTYMPIGNLTTTEIGIIYRQSGELQLPECECFAELLEYCRETLYSGVNDSNRLVKLQEFWNAGFDMSHPLFVDTLKSVIMKRDHITLNQIVGLPPYLRILIGAFLGDKDIASQKDVDELAIALQQHPSLL